MQNGVGLDDSSVCLTLCLNIQQQRTDLRRCDLWHFHIPQDGVDSPVKTILVVGSSVFAHCDGLRRHEHTLPILAQGQYFGRFCRLLSGLCRGFCGFPCVLLMLLCTAYGLACITLPLKLCRHSGKLALNGLLAPAIRRIPPAGKAGLAAATADADLIEDLAGFGCHFPGRRHIRSPLSSFFS